MELKDYTTEELKAEIEHRTAINKAKREEEKKNAMICRNCKYCVAFSLSQWTNGYKCTARTWGKKSLHNYRVRLSTKACDKFIRKEE